MLNNDAQEAEQQEIWNQQQLALKENLKAQIDRMLVTDVAYDDFDDENRAQTVTFKGFWL